MKLLVPAVALLMTIVFSSCQQDRKEIAPIGTALQAAMDESIKDSGAIGVSAAVIFPDGEMWAGATGISHEGAPLTTDMLFDIASAQKNLQAALALTLLEEGVLALDDPLEKWLPPIPHVDAGITVRQLLNMTSGIYDFVGDPESPFRIGYVNIDLEHLWTWEEIQEIFVREPSFEPATKCQYSSTNYIVLRHVIERATRSKQSALLEDRVLKPNRLDHTLADFSSPIPEKMRIAHGWFDTNGDGAPEDISDNSLNWIISLSPMLVYSTPTDMVKWMDALYHEKTVLKEETLKEMLTFIGPVQGEPLMKGYGLGTVDINLGALMPRWEQVRVYGHLGSQFGYMTFAGYFPDYGVSLAIMSNRGCDRDSDRAMMTVGGAVIDVLLRYLGAKESELRDSVSDLIKKLEQSPNDVHLMYKIAKQHQANKDDYEASLVYEEMLKRDPDDRYGYRTEALYWKAAYDGLIWKKPENLIAFISGHEDYKDIKDAYRWLVKTYMRRSEMDKAIEVYRDALQAIGKDAEFYNDYAWWVYENKVKSEYEIAVGYAKTAVELKPEAYYIWDTLAWLYFERGEQKLAVEASSKALSLAPERDRGDMEKALAKIKQGKS
jgi:D-alanyl-D-alanine carboxypeptidase